jgi:hypothetical protein
LLGICDGRASKFVALVLKLIYFLLPKLITNARQPTVSQQLKMTRIAFVEVYSVALAIANTTVG